MTCRKMTLEHSAGQGLCHWRANCFNSDKACTDLQKSLICSIMFGEAVSGLRGNGVGSAATSLFLELGNQVWASPLTLLLAINAIYLVFMAVYVSVNGSRSLSRIQGSYFHSACRSIHTTTAVDISEQEERSHLAGGKDMTSAKSLFL